jgi:hypothetical protein
MKLDESCASNAIFRLPVAASFLVFETNFKPQKDSPEPIIVFATLKVDAAVYVSCLISR